MNSTLVLILVYLVGLVGLGLWIGRRVEGSGGFFVATDGVARLVGCNAFKNEATDVCL